MKNSDQAGVSLHMIDASRRRLLGAAGSGAVASLLGGTATRSGLVQADEQNVLRWGIVGTGFIANSMAKSIRESKGCELSAVSSRRMESAQSFADEHHIPNAYDSWLEMARSNEVDALYLATPTSVKEEISLAASSHGKHVLAEKPFASLSSLQNITAACRERGLVFMDGTHFVHHPRTLRIRNSREELLGWPWSVASAFAFNLPDRGNIRYSRELEPMGAIGDAGWYNMRAAVEYLAPDVEPVSVKAFLRRDPQTGAAVSGNGVIRFDDGSVTNWSCGFESGATIMDLCIAGTAGIIKMDNFLGEDSNGSASFTYRKGSLGPGGTQERVVIPGSATDGTLMFQDFAALVDDAPGREASMRASERTQRLLDASWEAAIEDERS